MKVRVTKDERYPDYCFSSSDYHSEIELTEEEYNFIVEASKLYETAQNILEEKYCAVTQSRRYRFEGSIQWKPVKIMTSYIFDDKPAEPYKFDNGEHK